MLRFILRRILTAIPTLFVIVTVSFFLIRLAPGGPFNQERGLSPVIQANLERSYGLNLPLWQQYWHYLRDLLHGDFGPSYTSPDFSVGELFRIGLPVSMELGFSALLVALIGGIILGTIAALRQNSPIDYMVTALSNIGSVLPTFVIAPLYQLIFALTLHWVPVGGWNDGAFVNKIGPIVTLALPYIAIVARLMRGSMIEALHAHHIRTARALGLSRWSIIVRHAMRSAILPIVSFSGPAAAALITGSLVVEKTFQVPGVGRYFVDAALNRDYTLVMGTVVVVAIFTIAFNLLVDVIYAFVDPRVRYE